MKRLRWIVIVAFLFGGCVATEVACHRRADPRGRVVTLGEFLEWKPGVTEFREVEVEGRPYVIAYGPAGRSFLLSSGPAGYVFDADGRLVDWSFDIGDHPAFADRWTAQAARGRGRPLSRSEVVSFSASRPSN